MSKKVTNRKKIKLRIRNKISGTASLPRLSVFRSNKSIYCQLVDDLGGKTLASASSNEVDGEGNKSDVAKKVGQLLAEKAKNLSLETIVFDRNGYLYHGRVKALADGAREGGLKF